MLGGQPPRAGRNADRRHVMALALATFSVPRLAWLRLKKTRAKSPTRSQVRQRPDKHPFITATDLTPIAQRPGISRFASRYLSLTLRPQRDRPLRALFQRSGASRRRVQIGSWAPSWQGLPKASSASSSTLFSIVATPRIGDFLGHNY